MNNSSGKTETIIAAVVGAIVQSVVTYIFTNWAQIGIVFAFLAAFPISLIMFFMFSYLINRLYVHKKEKDFPIQGKTEATPSTEVQSSNLPNEVITILKEMGIVGATSRLSESKFEPDQCMAQAHRKLFFMGILGSKWVILPHVRAEFVKFLKRVQAQNGSVRFLLIEPESRFFGRLKTLREGAISDESLQHFKMLMKEFSCLEVRLYDQMPCFRLVFIDDKILAVSRYKIDKEGYFQSKFGWEAPHIIVDSSAPWSLYSAFELYYEQIWDGSKDLNLTISNLRR